MLLELRLMEDLIRRYLPQVVILLTLATLQVQKIFPA
nr:MAG TPA: hypothetical protein [Bacteriophage sp.]